MELIVTMVVLSFFIGGVLVVLEVIHRVRKPNWE